MATSAAPDATRSTAATKRRWRRGSRWRTAAGAAGASSVPWGRARWPARSARRGVERLAQLAEQDVRHEGLLDEGHVVAEQAVADDGVVGVARHEDDAEARPRAVEPLDKVGAA